ncbi:hypothetical protein [Ktedonobacter racemifer]|uniref:Uncharacterized protein n=1 Tax=Ktedonobacter racemifer DSM 44963 TaxID=485913 RepID=D6TZP1_KTERA|nr:hypothetical protein [Ktedonobacter racemifer]EFH82031.1 hypothetical protein Krac_2805 [Ktedonobacter racemifer DSM 44963]
MTRRVIAITLLLVLMLLGLTAGVFANTIQRSLTLPDMQRMFHDGPVGKPTVVAQKPMTPTGKPTTPKINVLAQDTFQRQNQPFWGQASDGHTWTADANALAIFSVQNTAGSITDGNGTFNAVLGPASDNVDLLINGSLNKFTGQNNFGSVLRWRNVNNWYKAYIDGNHLIIMRRVAGVNQQLVSVPFAAQSGASYALRFRALGSQLMTRAWQTNTPEPATWQATIKDASLNKGQAGVRVLIQPGTLVKITSFTASAATGTV